MTITTPATRGVRPREPAPALTLPLLDGHIFSLGASHPVRFTMLVFFRGLHCPNCQAQLRELDRRIDELSQRGVDVVAVSGESRERTQRLHDEWKLRRLPLAYGLTEAQMREWGLFVSRGIDEHEPAVFNEPGLFLVDPSGVVYYESILSMPAGRPRLDDLLAGIDYWAGTDYPARGEA
jgi:peroxiredoxin